MGQYFKPAFINENRTNPVPQELESEESEPVKKTPIVLLLKKNNPMVSMYLKYLNKAGGDKVSTKIEQSAIRDMLTDLMHLCHERKIDFSERVKQAKEVFIEEMFLEGKSLT